MKRQSLVCRHLDRQMVVATCRKCGQKFLQCPVCGDDVCVDCDKTIPK